MTRSEQVFAEAQKYIPGGVNSPVRAFQSVGETPRMIARADKEKLYDVDGREYIDFVCSWGPMILGHNHPAVREAVIRAAENGLSFGAATEIETEVAKLICTSVPSIEMIRMVNSGTEAVMSAIPGGPGIYGAEPCHQIRGLLPWTQRCDVGQGGFRRDDQRRSGQRWGSSGMCGGYADGGL